MKGWLARAVANTVRRGEQPRNRFARWSEWFPAATTVDESCFQGADEPHPRHWREFPEAWPVVDPADPAVRDALATAIDELPRPWREVVLARDALGRDVEQVRERQGRTPEHQRAMLNRARARLREQLARYFARGGGG